MEAIEGNGTQAVGTEITLSDEDIALLRAAEHAAMKLQQELGLKRTEYLAYEARMFAAIQKASQEFHAVVSMIARKHGIEVGAERDENWNFDAKAMIFVRTR